jgi:hypothetical protein
MVARRPGRHRRRIGMELCHLFRFHLEAKIASQMIRFSSPATPALGERVNDSKVLDQREPRALGSAEIDHAHVRVSLV